MTEPEPALSQPPTPADEPRDRRTAPVSAGAPASPSRGGIGRASVLLASGTLVSRVLGFVKTIVLASVIGLTASPAANAFGLANQLPNNVYALIGSGVLTAVIVPQIVRASKAADGGQAYVNKIITFGLTLFIASSLITTLLAPALVDLYARSSDGGGNGFSPADMALATAFAYWCLPQILFYAIYSLLGEVFNARQVFGPFTWAPVVNNVVAILGILAVGAVFVGDPRRSGAWSPAETALLAGTATLGVVAQAAVLVVFWRRTGLSFRPDFRWRGVGLLSTGRAAGWVFAMVLVTQIAGVVQSQVASIANQAASIAALQTAWLVFMLPHSIVAVSLATAYFTRMSGHAAADDLASVRTDLSTALRQIGVLLVFANVALFVLALPLARVFESGFDQVAAFGGVLMAFLVGLVPFSVLFLLQRVFYATHDTRTPFLLQLTQVLLFSGAAVAIAVAGVAVDWIAISLALAMSAAGTVQTVLALRVLHRRLGGLDAREVLKRFAQYAGCALLAGGIGALVALSLGSFRAGGFAVSGIGAALITLVVVGGVMGLVYAGLLALLRVPELTAIASPLVRRIRRR